MTSLYGFSFTEAARDFLQALQPKLRGQIKRKIEALAREPFPPTACVVQGMGDETEKVWRIRSGDYRILYVVGKPTITIIDIDHRKDVYR